MCGQSYGFSSRHVWMWELNHKESWTPKNWCFQIVVLEKTVKSLLDCKEIKPVNPKGNQLWIFIGRTDTEAGALILQPPDVKTDSLGKTHMLWKIEGRRRGQQRIRWLDSITDSIDMNLNKLGRYWKTEEHGVLQSMESKELAMTQRLKNNNFISKPICNYIKKKMFSSFTLFS